MKGWLLKAVYHIDKGDEINGHTCLADIQNDLRDICLDMKNKSENSEDDFDIWIEIVKRKK